jgi:hypothetical protein
MSFWVLPVTVNLNGLATGAMKVNCDHERTLKATIIPLIQLIGGITDSGTQRRRAYLLGKTSFERHNERIYRYVINYDWKTESRSLSLVKNQVGGKEKITLL